MQQDGDFHRESFLQVLRFRLALFLSHTGKKLGKCCKTTQIPLPCSKGTRMSS